MLIFTLFATLGLHLIVTLLHCVGKFSGILQPRYLFVRRQGHEHGVVPNIRDVQLCHVVLLKNIVGVFVYLRICYIQLRHVVFLKNIFGVMQHATHLIFSSKECEFAEWVSIVSCMKQSYLDIQQSAFSHRM